MARKFNPDGGKVEKFKMFTGYIIRKSKPWNKKRNKNFLAKELFK